MFSADRRVLTIAVLGGVFFASLLWTPCAVKGASITVSAVVVSEVPVVPQNPTVELHGYATPNATLTVKRDGVTVATGTAGSNAEFSITLTNQPVGQQTYIIYAVDADGHALAPLTFVITLGQNTTTIITGAFLGPSIAIDKDSVKLGEPVVVSGITVPGSSVTLTVNSVHAFSYTSTAGSDGTWSKTLDTGVLGVGTHTAKARAVTPSSTVSSYSHEVSFAVNALEKCDGKKTADLNCDGSVNLTDFSILLYFWQSVNPANLRADINKDGQVTIVDFSIMLYQWTG